MTSAAARPASASAPSSARTRNGAPSRVGRNGWPASLRARSSASTTTGRNSSTENFVSKAPPQAAPMSSARGTEGTSTQRRRASTASTNIAVKGTSVVASAPWAMKAGTVAVSPTAMRPASGRRRPSASPQVAASSSR